MLRGRLLFLALLWLSCAAAITATLTVIASQTALLKSMEHWTSDWRGALLADRAPTQHGRVAVILIDDDTMHGYAYRSPVDRSLLARLVETLDAAGARVIALDFLFDQPTEPDKDRQLIAAVRKAADKVVMGIADARIPLRAERREYMDKFVREAGAATGFVNLRYEIDNVVRGEADPMPNATGKASTTDSFAAAIARKVGVPVSAPAVRISWLRSPHDGSDTFLALPAAQIVAPSDETERRLAAMLLASLKDRVVLIGGDLSDQTDRHPTPLSKIGEDRTPGVLIHTQAVAQMLDGRHIQALSVVWETVLVLGMSLTGILLGWRIRASRWITSTLPIVLLGLTDAIFFAGFRTIVPFAAPALAWLAGIFTGRGLRCVLVRIGL